VFELKHRKKGEKIDIGFSTPSEGKEGQKPGRPRGEEENRNPGKVPLPGLHGPKNLEACLGARERPPEPH